MAEDFIPLAEAIAALRKEIIVAMDAGKTETVRFKLGPVDLEFNLVVGREAGGGGKIAFKLFGSGAEASADAKLKNERTHRLRITLFPVDEWGGPLVAAIIPDDGPGERPFGRGDFVA